MRRLPYVAAVLFVLCGLSVATAQTLQGRWSIGPPLPAQRGEVAVALLGNDVYVIAGSTNAVASIATVQSFDTARGTWQTRAPLPRELNHVGASGLNGKVYTVGGFAKSNADATADCFAYDPGTNRWTPIAPLPNKRGSVSVAALDGKLHAVGGRDTVSVTEHDVYDPATGKWTAAAPLPPAEGRDHMGLAAYGGKLYAIAGRFTSSTNPTNLFEVYDPASDRWRELPPMPTARSGGVAAAYRDRILYMGGELRNGRNGGVFTDNEAYDPVTNAWSDLAPMPSGRHGAGAVVAGDKVYIPAGGARSGGGMFTDTLQIFSLP